MIASASKTWLNWLIPCSIHPICASIVPVVTSSSTSPPLFRLPVRSSLAATSTPVMRPSCSTKSFPASVSATLQPNNKRSAPGARFDCHVLNRSV